MAFQSSHVAASPNLVQAISVSTNGMLVNPSCNRSINLGFPTGPVHSNISLPLSNITGESSVTDYQDCGLSPMFLTGESPWDSNLEVGCPEARDKAKMRYNEKKKTRMYVVQLSTCRICNLYSHRILSIFVVFCHFSSFFSKVFEFSPKKRKLSIFDANCQGRA